MLSGLEKRVFANTVTTQHDISCSVIFTRHSICRPSHKQE